jgi:hypothetical protein
MQEGIGRGGYRVLAIVFFGVGALGLVVAAVALKPTGFFEWLGFALAALSLACLCGLTLATLGGTAAGGRTPRVAPPSFEPAGAPGEAVPLPTPEPPLTADPAADLGFEFPDFEPMPGLPPVADVPVSRPTPTGPPPRAMARPAATTAPPSGRARKANDGGWPDRTPKAGMTRRQVAERDLPRDPGPDIQVEGPGPARREAPVVMARTVASAEATGIPDGSSVGKCGNCGVLLLAPKKRPIRLQCPRCERVHTLA